jgi:hypothetical protein
MTRRVEAAKIFQVRRARREAFGVRLACWRFRISVGLSESGSKLDALQTLREIPAVAHGAVSPNCIRQRAAVPDGGCVFQAVRITNPRYSRLKICATFRCVCPVRASY